MKYPFDCISDFIFADTEVKKADIILVPGGSWRELMVRAAELYHQGYAPYILPSGRYNPKLSEYSSEWEFLKKTGEALGVPEEAILKEDKAANTFDNARLSLEIIREKGISVKEAILVCKGYYSRRALLTYQTVFPKDVKFYVSTVTNSNNLRKDNWFRDGENLKKVMGEVVKIGKYFEGEIPGILSEVESLEGSEKK